MFLGQTDSLLETLKDEIINRCVIDPVDNSVLVVGKTLVELWKASGFNRKLTKEECVYIVQSIREYYLLNRADDPELIAYIMSYIGEEEKIADSIFSLVNIGIIGVFAFIGYKIISRKK
jgi:hypothetical protein